MFRPPIFGARRGRTLRNSAGWFHPRWRTTSGSTNFTKIRMKPNSTIKEKALNPEERAARPAIATTRELPSETKVEELDERIVMALHAAGEKKALEIVVLDLRNIANFTDYFLIASGANERQVQAISDEVVEKLKKSGTPAARVEGYRAAEWILMDYGDFIVHVFADKARKFYDLERLWREGKRVELPAELKNEPVSSLRKESCSGLGRNGSRCA